MGAGVVFSILVLNLDVREVQRFGKECSDGLKDEISYHCWLDSLVFMVNLFVLAGVRVENN